MVSGQAALDEQRLPAGLLRGLPEPCALLCQIWLRAVQLVPGGSAGSGHARTAVDPLAEYCCIHGCLAQWPCQVSVWRVRTPCLETLHRQIAELVCAEWRQPATDGHAWLTSLCSPSACLAACDSKCSVCCDAASRR